MIESAMQPKLNATLQIDCRGKIIKTTRRVLRRGSKYVEGSSFLILSKMFDPECEEFLTPENDGSVNLDFEPAFIEYLVNYLEADSVETADIGHDEFECKFGEDVVDQW